MSSRNELARNTFGFGNVIFGLWFAMAYILILFIAVSSTGQNFAEKVCWLATYLLFWLLFWSGIRIVNKRRLSFILGAVINLIVFLVMYGYVLFSNASAKSFDIQFIIYFIYTIVFTFYTIFLKINILLKKINNKP